MSCYTNELKNTCSKVVAGISVLLGIAGIATAALGFNAKGGLPKELLDAIKKTGVNFEVSEAFATPIIAFGILLLVISFLGCATAKFKNPCFAIPFGLLNCVFGLILIIVGGLALGGGELAKAAFNVACPEQAQDRSKLSPFDQKYRNNVDNNMCTDVCPCFKGAAGAERYPFNMADADLRSMFGRTTEDLTTAEQTEYTNKGARASMVQLKSVGAATDKNYDTFKACYDEELSKSNFKDSNKNAEFKAWVQNEGFKTIAALEKDLKCSGLCATPMFFATANFWEKPEEVCVIAMKKRLTGPLRTAGNVAIVTAIIAFIAFAGSFPLCSKYADDDEEHKD